MQIKSLIIGDVIYDSTEFGSENFKDTLQQKTIWKNLDNEDHKAVQIIQQYTPNDHLDIHNQIIVAKTLIKFWIQAITDREINIDMLWVINETQRKMIMSLNENFISPMGKNIEAAKELFENMNIGEFSNLETYNSICDILEEFSLDPALVSLLEERYQIRAYYFDGVGNMASIALIRKTNNTIHHIYLQNQNLFKLKKVSSPDEDDCEYYSGITFWWQPALITIHKNICAYVHIEENENTLKPFPSVHGNYPWWETKYDLYRKDSKREQVYNIGFSNMQNSEDLKLKMKTILSNLGDLDGKGSISIFFLDEEWESFIYYDSSKDTFSEVMRVVEIGIQKYEIKQQTN